MPYLGALGVSALLLGTGVGIGGSALVATLPYVLPILPIDSTNPIIIQFAEWLANHYPAGEAVSGGAHGGVDLEKLLTDSSDAYIQAAALGISAVSIVGKEDLFRYTLLVKLAFTCFVFTI